MLILKQIPVTPEYLPGILNTKTDCQSRQIAWKPDPHSLAADAMQQEWNQEILYAFPPFSLIQRVLCKIAKEKVSAVI